MTTLTTWLPLDDVDEVVGHVAVARVPLGQGLVLVGVVLAKGHVLADVRVEIDHLAMKKGRFIF